MAELSLTSNNSSFPHQPSFKGTTQNPLLSFLENTYFISGISMAVLSFIAMTANGLLLLAIWKDPHKRFRTPSSVFIFGLTLADFLTGILVGPIISYIRIALFASVSAKFPFGKVGQISSMVTMNASYIILLFLTWNQFAAIRFPHKHRCLVTCKKVTACVVSAWAYSLLFASLFLWVKEDVVYQIDFYAHNCTFIIFLAVAYVCLCVAFRRQTSRIVATTSNRLHTEHYQNNSSKRRRNTEKQFTVVALVLVLFIIVCTLPTTVIHMLYEYDKDFTSESSEKTLRIAREISSVILFLKFVLDPFLYCWRLSSYRRALRTVLSCGKTRSLIGNVSASRSARSVRNETRPPGSNSCNINTAL